MRPRVAIVAGVAVLASAALLFVVARRENPWARLNEAVLRARHRPFETRLSGFDWAPRPRVTRSAEDSSAEAGQLHLRAIAAEIVGSNASESIRAVAALLDGSVPEGRRRLQALTAQTAAVPATVWSDLAVARAAGDNDDVWELCSALAAADRALDLDPSLPEARFNRAVILESLSFRTAAERAYGDYLTVDGISAWASEARARLLGLHAPRTRADEWQALLPRLERAAAAGDDRVIDDVSTRFPQEARTWGEAEFLGRWAEYAAKGDGTNAAAMLALARAIGASLRRTTGESLLSDSVAVIVSASSDRSRFVALTAAHRAYREGRKAYGVRDVAASVSLLRTSRQLFEQTRSPMALLAGYYLGNAAIDSGDVTDAARIMKGLDALTPKSYRALLAQMDWLRGSIAGLDGFADRNLIAYERSYEGFNTLHEEQNAAEMRARIAALLTILGRPAEAWRMRRDAFAAASSTGDPWRVEIVVYSAAVDALGESRWDVAHSLFNVVCEIESGNPRLHAEALVWRAFAAYRAGMTNATAFDLRAARAAPGSLKDGDLREDVANTLRLAEAVIVREKQSHRSVGLLTEYLASARRRGRSTWLPQVLVERARSNRAAGDDALAESDLRQAISIVEERRTAIARDDLRDSFLGKSNEAYSELADLLDARGDTSGALAVADRPRARVLLDRVSQAVAEGGVAPMAIAKTLEPHKTILAYSLFEKRLVIFALSRRGVERFTVPITAADLERLVAELAMAVEHRERKTADERARDLGRILIAPALSALHDADTLLFVCDPELQQIPFAALRQQDGRFVVESYATMVAPSVASCTPRTAKTTKVPESLLAVGNPRLSQDRFASLPSLRAAEGEARKIASMYRSSTVLLGTNASTERVLASFPLCDVVHIATHAVLDSIDPVKSRLLLAGENSLTVEQVAALHLEHLQLVILAGCRTAVSSTGYGDIRTLAAGFLASGARNVVASLWNVDDDLTRELSVSFHRELRRGRGPVEALRIAQLQMLQSTDPRLTDPRAWGALQLYGLGE